MRVRHSTQQLCYACFMLITTTSLEEAMSRVAGAVPYVLDSPPIASSGFSWTIQAIPEAIILALA